MVLIVFGRLASGELGRDGGACSFCGDDLGGVDALVITLERIYDGAITCEIFQVAGDV